MRLLLVEDEPLTIKMLAKGLREQAYAVDVAQTAAAARLMVSDHDYDLIILDLNLPDGDGVTLCRQIRDAGTSASILILTARDAVDSRIAGLDNGADDYLLKPFDFGELLARLRALARRGARPIHGERVRICDLVLDTHAQQASCGDTPLPLTTREYALLEFMVQRAGRVVTRADIAEHVWDSAYDPMSNVVDVYVRRLRSKLGGTTCQDVIRTRRGAGYILDADGLDPEP